MPELPEIETIKLDLNKLIKDKKIKSVDINLAKQIKMSKAKFLNLVKNSKIKQVKRRAKILLIELDNNYYLIFHLKMTGQLIYRSLHGKLAGGGHPINQDLQNLPNKYSHVIFNFNDGSQLFFNDTRQFGWVKLVDKQGLKEIELKLGPEPLKINFEKFKEIFSKKRVAIKSALMEQSVIAGVGNIYAMETCYCAKVTPVRLASELTQQELKKIFNCLIKILKLAIAKKGTTAKDYVDALGRQGSMWPYLNVYGRAGKKCKRCGHKLIAIKQRQRTTIYCENCQK